MRESDLSSGSANHHAVVSLFDTVMRESCVSHPRQTRPISVRRWHPFGSMVMVGGVHLATLIDIVN